MQIAQLRKNAKRSASRGVAHELRRRTRVFCAAKNLNEAAHGY
jgi:hypothetical protein